MNDDRCVSKSFPLAAMNVKARQRVWAPVAKWLTLRSAKPAFAGSNPARCSKYKTPLGGKLIAVVPVVSNLFEERNS